MFLFLYPTSSMAVHPSEIAVPARANARPGPKNPTKPFFNNPKHANLIVASLSSNCYCFQFATRNGAAAGRRRRMTYSPPRLVERGGWKVSCNLVGFQEQSASSPLRF